MRTERRKKTTFELWSGLFFRLLPYQVLLLIIDAANGIVDSICASNFIGQTAMAAIGLYSPLNHFLFAMSIMLVSGSQLMLGKALGSNETDSVESFFSTDLIISLILSGIVSALLLFAGLTDATKIITSDPANRAALNQYLIGQSFGIPGLVLGQQLFAFLSMENQRKRTMIASLVCMAVNTAMDLLLIGVFRMGTFGLGLGSAIAVGSFCAVMLQYYISGRSGMKFSVKAFSGRNSLTIAKRGYPGAMSRFVEMFRCIIVNILLLRYVGSGGLSAFAAVNSVMAVFWPITFGMMAVTRMLLSITIGEEDRQSVSDIMRVVLIRGGLLQCGITAFIMALAVPFANMFYHNPADPVYMMTVMGFRLMPLCMPLAVMSLAFACFAQAMEDKFLSNVLPVVDGAVSVVVFAIILIPVWKINGLYIANILNGFVCAALVILYAMGKKKHFPRNIDDLLVMPEDFGAPEDARIDIEVRRVDEVNEISGQVTAFCKQRGAEEKQAVYAGLALEEMAGNVVEHGFTADHKRHVVAIRVVHKDEDVILRILDNCTAFDPLTRMKELNENDEKDRNIGIRIVHNIAKDVAYQNLLGLNVLTLKI